MTVYEQQARALKEIAAELKGIRRALNIISDSLKPDIKIVDEQEVECICGADGLPCILCTEGPCEHRKKGGAGNG